MAIISSISVVVYWDIISLRSIKVIAKRLPIR